VVQNEQAGAHKTTGATSHDQKKQETYNTLTKQVDDALMYERF
jgi:hypothetical protein